MKKIIAFFVIVLIATVCIANDVTVDLMDDDAGNLWRVVITKYPDGSEIYRYDRLAAWSSTPLPLESHSIFVPED